MASATLTKPVISENSIKAAEAEAVRLCALAFAPQPVKQPDGSELMLCWHGRISRAYDKLAGARLAKNDKAVAAITAAIVKLEADATAAHNAANQAASAWAAQCASAGVACDAMACYPPQCACDGCTKSRTAGERIAAYGALSMSIYTLLAPSSVTLPPFVELMRQADNPNASDALWRYLKTIWDNAEAYGNACAADGVRPNWRGALYPVEG